MQCKDCHWWKIEESKNQSNGSILGRCKRRSPSVSAVVMPVMKSQLTREIVLQIIKETSWPLLAGETEACGDFKKREEPSGGFVSIGADFAKEVKEKINGRKQKATNS